MDPYRIGPLPFPKAPSTDSLSSKSGGGDEAKLKKAAQAFESYFVFTLLKEMQKTTPGKGMFGKGPEGEIYQHLFQQALADKISTGSNGIGLTKFLTDELRKRGNGGGQPAPTGGFALEGSVGDGKNSAGFPLRKTGFAVGNGESVPPAGSGLPAPRVGGQYLGENDR